MEFLKVTDQREPFVALIELNRPKELNALNSSLMGELRDTLVNGHATQFVAGSWGRLVRHGASDTAGQ